jgi:excisionase family DNA binding protein
MRDDLDLFDAVQAATYLGVHRQRVYDLARAGRIGRRVGALWVFSRRELDAYKEERAQRPKGGRPSKLVDESGKDE